MPAQAHSLNKEKPVPWGDFEGAQIYCMSSVDGEGARDDLTDYQQDKQ